MIQMSLHLLSEPHSLSFLSFTVFSLQVRTDKGETLISRGVGKRGKLLAIVGI